jgi:ABC-type multidrug transport system permease subunit
MVATPMSKSAFLLAQFIARLGLSGMEVAIILVFTWAYFGIELQGSAIAFFLLFIAGNAAFTGIAIMVSSRTSNSQIGNGLINIVVMPMMILSGIFFSYHGFPDWMVNIIRWLPLTMLADSVRSVFNEGALLSDVLPTLGALFGIGFITYATGIRIYKWY